MVIVHGIMLRTAIIPERYRTRFPVKAAHVLGFGDMFIQHIQQRIALGTA
jgi:glyoxylate utilization-related uncharacterized protein